MQTKSLSRRTVLKGGISLVVGISSTGAVTSFSLATSLAKKPPYPFVDLGRAIIPTELDTWLAVHGDGRLTAYFGKTDVGQGVDTAIAQVVAEELDVAVENVTVVMADTALTPNQGGASASSAVWLGARPLRNAAAEARAIILYRASVVLGAPPEELAINDGQVFLKSAPGKLVSFHELISPDGFHTTLNEISEEWGKPYGVTLNVAGTAKPKNPSQYRIVGQSTPRRDIPGKVLATTEYCHHVVLPGMLHGRMVRPPVAGATPVKVNEHSIADIKGAKVVWKKDFLGIVAQTEWDAIKASRKLEVQWSNAPPPFPAQEALYDYIRAAPVVASSGGSAFFGKVPYDVEPTMRALDVAGTRLVEAEYTIPFNSHARMAPSIGIADVRANEAVVYNDGQKPHAAQMGLAKTLGLKTEDVRVIWKPGPGSYGRSDADEAAFEAAVMSQAIGRPVRVQWMRNEGHAWDPKAPPAVISLKAGLNHDGAVTAWYFRAKAFSGWDTRFNAENPQDTLAGMLLGWDKVARAPGAHNFGVPSGSYAFPNAVKYWETIAPFLDIASPLRCSHMRAPQEFQIAFAHECFIDEVASAARQDPIEFRLQYLRNEREKHVLQQLALALNWKRRSAMARSTTGDILRGCGVSLGAFGVSFVATACEVEIDLKKRRLWPRRFTVVHDCGLIINPAALRLTIEGNVIQGLSRSMCEEVVFNPRSVESVDWETYPILDVVDVPEAIDIVTVNRPEVARVELVNRPT